MFSKYDVSAEQLCRHDAWYKRLSHVGLRLYVYRDDEFSKANVACFPV